MACWNVIADHTFDSAGYANFTVTIPDEYDHLYFVLMSRNGYNGPYQRHEYRLSGDGEYNYSNQRFYTAGTTMYGDYKTRGDNERGITDDSQGSYQMDDDTFSVFTLWIPDHRGSGFKQCISRSHVPSSTADTDYYVTQTAGMWHNTGRVSSLRFTGVGGHEYGEFTRYTAYGINGV